MNMNTIMVLDCETATLPFVNEWKLTAKDKQTIAIAKPLVYDIGWCLTLPSGHILKKVSYLVQETFFVPNVFNTAYYREKRPMYMDKLNKGEIAVKCWNDIVEELLFDCKCCDFVSAYNAQFDFKKAIPFTDRYIEKLYSSDYNAWEYGQRKSAESMIKGDKPKSENWDAEHFILRGEQFDVVDIWAVACEQLVNKFAYKKACGETPMISGSGLYFKTSAESVFRYLVDDYDFNEEHTALADAEIEVKILAKAYNEGKEVVGGIRAFPFRELGTTTEFLLNAMRCDTPTVSQTAVANVIDMMETYLDAEQGENDTSTFAINLSNNVITLTGQMNRTYGTDRKPMFPTMAIDMAIARKKAKIENAKSPDFKEKLERELADLLEQRKAILDGVTEISVTPSTAKTEPTYDKAKLYSMVEKVIVGLKGENFTLEIFTDDARFADFTIAQIRGAVRVVGKVNGYHYFKDWKVYAKVSE